MCSCTGDARRYGRVEAIHHGARVKIKWLDTGFEDGSRFDPPDLLWTWSITSIWPATKGVTNGTAATRDEAMAKFRAAWTRMRGVHTT